MSQKPTEHWHNVRGQLHRDGDLVAEIRYYASGQVKFEGYAQNGQWHRDNGPARLYFYVNGQVWNARWYDHGELLAEIEYFEDGNIAFITGDTAGLFSGVGGK